MDKNYTQKQLETLPKWAKHEIERLFSNAEHFERQASEIGGAEPTNTRIWRGMDTPLYLPNDSLIEFVADNGDVFQVKRTYAQAIEIRLVPSVSNQMIICPHLSNTFTVKSMASE